MDEIDSIGSSRIESGSGGDSEVQRTMLELLNQLDGFEATKNIKVCQLVMELGTNGTFMWLYHIPKVTKNVRILRNAEAYDKNINHITG
jgi:SpoVK/Ycf46/Vps4 family AAA+-type ATPase